jgi:hypothetical protein
MEKQCLQAPTHLVNKSYEIPSTTDNYIYDQDMRKAGKFLETKYNIGLAMFKKDLIEEFEGLYLENGDKVNIAKPAWMIAEENDGTIENSLK